MPRGARSDWHLPALIIGTAVMAFFLGSTTTLWLATAPLTGVARGTNALNEKPMSGDMSASASSPAGPAKASTVQETNRLRLRLSQPLHPLRPRQPLPPNPPHRRPLHPAQRSRRRRAAISACRSAHSSMPPGQNRWPTSSRRAETHRL